eukprot:3826589-Prymnesium_polylepis.2
MCAVLHIGRGARSALEAEGKGMASCVGHPPLDGGGPEPDAGSRPLRTVGGKAGVENVELS